MDIIIICYNAINCMQYHSVILYTFNCSQFFFTDELLHWKQLVQRFKVELLMLSLPILDMGILKNLKSKIDTRN